MSEYIIAAVQWRTRGRLTPRFRNMTAEGQYEDEFQDPCDNKLTGALVVRLHAARLGVNPRRAVGAAQELVRLVVAYYDALRVVPLE